MGISGDDVGAGLDGGNSDAVLLVMDDDDYNFYTHST